MTQLIILHSASWFPWLLDILIKSAVLLTITGLAALACWRVSAAQRHLIWTLAVIGVLLLPLLSTVLPSWHVVRLPEWRSTSADIQAPANTPEQPRMSHATAQDTQRPSSNTLTANIETPRAPSAGAGVESPNTPMASATPEPSMQTTVASSWPAWSWYAWAILIWGIGSALILAWLAYGYAVTRRMRKRGTPAPEAWKTEVPTGICLMISHAIAMPIVVGIRQPTILLPAQAEEWPEDRRRVVLLHELAHIQRRDLSAHLLTQLACACYWMNPLIWYAAYRMRVERETACDDAVLNAKIKASDYAVHLLNVACVLKERHLVSVTGIGMARSSRVRRRIKGVLDEKRNRRGISKWMLAVTVVCMLFILMTITSAQETGGTPDKPQPSQTLGAQTPNAADASELLAAAKTEMTALPQRVMTTVKDQLTAQVIIQEASADPGQAMVQASRVQEPFYASLAMGGVTAVQLQQRSPEAAANYRKAVERARTIRHYTGEYPTSLHFLFMLVPYFPGEQAREMLTYSRQHCMAPYAADDTDDVINQYPLLALAKATVAVEPAAAHNLLFSVAVKSNHYWASSEYLATWLAGQDLASTLRDAKQSYDVDHDSSSQYALRAALFVLARTDLNKAMAEIWRMQEPDDEIAALTLAQQLLAAGKKEEAKQVVADVGKQRGNSSLEWTGRTLRELRRQLAANTVPATPSVTITPEMIDDFLAKPTAETLECFSTQHQVVFRDKDQAARFVTAALPLAATLGRVGLKDFGGGGPDQSAYGFLVSCTAIAGDSRQALEIAKKVTMPEMRAAYLLEAYAALKPLPPPVADWPIHLVHSSTVSLAGNQPTKVSAQNITTQPADPQQPITQTKKGDATPTSDPPISFHTALLVENGDITAYEPVLVRIEERNDSSQPAYLTTTASPWTTRILVEDTRGQVLATSPRWTLPLDFLTSGVRLKSGESHSRMLAVSAIYPFDKPGDYTVRVQRLKLQNEVMVLAEDQVTVHVLPFDAARLKARCENLFKYTRNAPGERDLSMSDLTRALLSVRHDIALPYIDWYVHNGDSRSHPACTALRLLGIPKALRELNTLAKRQDKLGRTARGVLEMRMDQIIWGILDDND